MPLSSLQTPPDLVSKPRPLPLTTEPRRDAAWPRPQSPRDLRHVHVVVLVVIAVVSAYLVWRAFATITPLSLALGVALLVLEGWSLASLAMEAVVLWDVDTVQAPPRRDRHGRDHRRHHPDAGREPSGPHAHTGRRHAHADGHGDPRAGRRPSPLARRHVRRTGHRLPHPSPVRRRHGRTAQRRARLPRRRLRRRPRRRPGRAPRLHQPDAGTLRRRGRGARADARRLLQRGLLRTRPPRSRARCRPDVVRPGPRGRTQPHECRLLGRRRRDRPAVGPRVGGRRGHRIRRAGDSRRASLFIGRGGGSSSTTRSSPEAAAQPMRPSTSTGEPLPPPVPCRRCAAATSCSAGVSPSASGSRTSRHSPTPSARGGLSATHWSPCSPSCSR